MTTHAKPVSSLGDTPSFSALLIQACEQTLRQGPRVHERQPRGPRALAPKSHALLKKAVARLDADQARRLIDEGVALWADEVSTRGKPSLYETWNQAARQGGASVAAAADVALVLDQAGIPMVRFGHDDDAKNGQELRKLAKKLAQGGAPKRQARQSMANEWMNDWNWMGPASKMGVARLWQSWTRDPEVAARVAPCDIVELVKGRQEKMGEVPVGFLGVVGAGAALSEKLWLDVARNLNASPLAPRHVDQRWGVPAWEAEAALSLQGKGLGAETAGMLARAAMRLDAPQCLANVAAMGPAEGFSLPVEAWGDFPCPPEAALRSSTGPSLLAHALAAVEKKRSPKGAELGWACFDALLMVPAAVEEAALSPVPQAFESLSAAHLELVWEREPRLFGKDAQGNNPLHFVGGSQSNLDGEAFCRRIFKCGLGQAFAFEPNADGKNAMSWLEGVFYGLERQVAPAGSGGRAQQWNAFCAEIEKKDIKTATAPVKKRSARASRL
jgi:hypothetical protein